MKTTVAVITIGGKRVRALDTGDGRRYSEADVRALLSTPDTLWYLVSRHLTSVRKIGTESVRLLDPYGVLALCELSDCLDAASILRKLANDDIGRLHARQDAR